MSGSAISAAGRPLVSVVIPCRNEERFIGACLDSVLATSYPEDRLEVLVVDGMSEDGTRATVGGYVRRHPCVRLLVNPKKITPAALNIGITAARGEIIIRMDAHSLFPAHYIPACVDYLERTGAEVVGGPIETRPAADTLIARSIALVTSHPFGVGDSKFRTSAKEGYVDTVPFGAYRREVFARVGLFDERLARNQDNELSSRILRSGGRIYLTRVLTAQYYNQATLRGLLRQAVRTGMWNVVTLRANPAAFRWRHFIPFWFVVVGLALGSAALVIPRTAPLFVALVATYGILAIGASLQLALRSGAVYLGSLPWMFFIYHVSYGTGSVIGILRMALGKDRVG